MKTKLFTSRIAAFSAALLLSTGIAHAGDLFNRGGSLKDAPVVHSDRPELSANVAITSDYVFRGISQTEENPAIQGGFDATYRMFYAGVWASNLDFGSDGNGNDVANIEIDIYAGLKHKWRNTEFDLGVIYYAYPGAEDAGGELDYVELKFASSTELTDRITFNSTTYWSPDYTGETGDVITSEWQVAIALGEYRGMKPTFSALIGYVDFLDDAFEGDSYTYWNAGVEVGLNDKFTLDLRYWDTDIADDNPTNGDNADARFVGTVSASF
jgi:uncharacterized protein (TIGR02001 family)